MCVRVCVWCGVVVVVGGGGDGGGGVCGGGGGGGGGLASTKPKGQHQCHTCGLQWPAPRGTPGVHQWQWQCTQMSSLQPMPMPTTTPSPRQFHGAQGCTSTRHAQRQACHVQVPIPLAMSMHPCHAQGRLGATPKPATSKMHAPQCISQATRVNPQGLPPSIDQPFSTTKMGWLVLPIVLWRH